MIKIHTFHRIVAKRSYKGVSKHSRPAIEENLCYRGSVDGSVNIDRRSVDYECSSVHTLTASLSNRYVTGLSIFLLIDISPATFRYALPVVRIFPLNTVVTSLLFACRTSKGIFISKERIRKCQKKML
ncbi:hypothetical protein M8J77_013219 [Diaphorina citri]|nr:hypothetical protein M8J77_013219 [Diaphorina citri]